MLRRTIIKSSVVLLPFSLLSRTSVSRCETNDKYISDNKFKVIKGKDFKQNNPKYFACKFIGSNLNNFKYKLGINKNTEKFNPIGECAGGGLYFADVLDVFLFDLCGDKIATIELLDDENIYIENYKCKTNKFNITSIDSIENFVNKLKIDDVERIIYRNPYDIRYMKNLPYDLPYELCKYVIDTNYELLEFIDNQTEELCKYAIEKSNGCALKYVKNQTNDICKFAIDINPFSIEHVETQTENLCLRAIEHDPKTIRCIGNPTLRVCEFTIERAKKNTSIYDERKIHAHILSKHWKLIDKISDPSYELRIIVLLGQFIGYINKCLSYFF